MSLILLISFFVRQSAFSIDPLLVQEVSPSSEYITIQLPEDTNYFKGYKTLLVRKIRPELEISAENIEVMAQMTLVELDEGKGMWKVKKRLGDGFLINEGDEVYLFKMEKNLLSGRMFDLDLEKKVVIESLKWVEQVPEHYFKGDSEFLKKFNKGFSIYHREEGDLKDFEGTHQVVEVQYWDQKKGGNQTVKYPKDFFKPVPKKALVEKRKKRALKSMIAYTISNKQDKTKFSKVKSKYPHIDFGNPRWSEKYTDEELEEILSAVGEEQERQLRLKILNQKYWFQLHLGGGFGLLNKQSANDEINRIDEQPSIEINLEYFLFKKIYLLKKFTTEFGYTIHNNVLSNNGKNIESSETFYKVALNYYPKEHYFEVKKFKMLYQFGILFGSADMNTDTAGETGSYSLDAFPVVSIGASYNFTKTFGARMFGSYIKKNYISQESGWQNNTTLRNNLSVKDIIVSAAISYMY